MGASMPTDIRGLAHMAPQHPSRAIACPHCRVEAKAACTTVSGRRRLTEPHPGRITAWARTTACCPACQVEPGVPCWGVGGTPLGSGDVHPQRVVEAGVTV